MMSCKQWSVALIALSLLLLMIPACGGGGEEKTATPTVTSTPTATKTPTPTATPSPIPAGPVKIGMLAPWSGPAATSGGLADQISALVEDQVKNQGGILGGRMVKFIRGDDRGMVSESIAQARKLIQDDKVTILCLGGVSGAQSSAVANVAEELKVPFAAYTTLENVEALKYSVELYGFAPAINAGIGFITNVVKPKTIAFLAKDDAPSRTVMEGIRKGVEAKGITTVYDQTYPIETVDFSAYLTKIKYVKPDILVSHLLTEQALNINQQIKELGGWEGIVYYGASPASAAAAVIKMPAAVGSYVALLWLPDSDEPGMKAFGDAFKQKYNRLPSPELAFFYNSMWIAIKAVELANSDDPAKVAEALRSGNLVWDSAYGPMHIPTNGEADMTEMVAQVQAGGKLVKVWPQ